MESDKAGRNGEFNTKMVEARALVAEILRKVAAADAYAIDLRTAIAAGDSWRMATLRADLHTAWTDAQGALDRLEQMSERPEEFARELLRRSQQAVRDLLRMLVREASASKG